MSRGGNRVVVGSRNPGEAGACSKACPLGQRLLAPARMMYFALELVKGEGPLTGQQGEGLLLEGRAMLTGPKSHPVRGIV